MTASAAKNKGARLRPAFLTTPMKCCSPWSQSLLDFSLVDFGAGLIDHDDASALAVIVEIDRDLPGDQIGGFPGVLLVLAIQPDRILEPNAVGNIEMKNGHCGSSCGVNAAKLNLFRDSDGRSSAKIFEPAVPAISGLGQQMAHAGHDPLLIPQRSRPHPPRLQRGLYGM
jgi:hypothetical protein